MDFSKTTLVQMLQTKMSYTHKRQDVLSQNIANIDTPGYKAKDVEKPNFDRMMQSNMHRVMLAKTHETHQQSSLGSSNFRTVEEREPFMVTPTGNTISMEDQMAKVAQNTGDHKMVINLYERTAAMFKKAATAPQ